MICSRCGKDAECKSYSFDIDLPILRFCADCKDIALYELNSGKLIQKKGTSKDWQNAFTQETKR